MGEKYVRTIIPERFLADYSDAEDALYGPDTLIALGVFESQPHEQLAALLEASEEIYRDLETTFELAVVPHELVEGENNWELHAARVLTPEDATTNQKLGFLVPTTRYHRYVVEQYVAMLNGEREDPIIFHNDMSRSGQFVFGSVGDEDPRVYLTDIDPEITVCARIEEDGLPTIEGMLPRCIVDLAATSFQMEDGTEKDLVQSELRELFAFMKSEGIFISDMPGQFDKIVERAFSRGDSFWADYVDYVAKR
jgi:hypothetical protein